MNQGTTGEKQTSAKIIPFKEVRRFVRVTAFVLDIHGDKPLTLSALQQTATDFGSAQSARQAVRLFEVTPPPATLGTAVYEVIGQEERLLLLDKNFDDGGLYS